MIKKVSEKRLCTVLGFLLDVLCYVSPAEEDLPDPSVGKRPSARLPADCFAVLAEQIAGLDVTFFPTVVTRSGKIATVTGQLRARSGSA